MVLWPAPVFSSRAFVPLLEGRGGGGVRPARLFKQAVARYCGQRPRRAESSAPQLMASSLNTPIDVDSEVAMATVSAKDPGAKRQSQRKISFYMRKLALDEEMI